MHFKENARESDYSSFLAAVGALFDVYLHSSRITAGNSVFIIRQHLNFYHLKLNCGCVYFARLCASSSMPFPMKIIQLHRYFACVCFYIKCFIICLFVRSSDLCTEKHRLKIVWINIRDSFTVSNALRCDWLRINSSWKQNKKSLGIFVTFDMNINK